MARSLSWACMMVIALQAACMDLLHHLLAVLWLSVVRRYSNACMSCPYSVSQQSSNGHFSKASQHASLQVRLCISCIRQKYAVTVTGACHRPCGTWCQAGSTKSLPWMSLNDSCCTHSILQGSVTNLHSHCWLQNKQHSKLRAGVQGLDVQTRPTYSEPNLSDEARRLYAALVVCV